MKAKEPTLQSEMAELHAKYARIAKEKQEAHKARQERIKSMFTPEERVEWDAGLRRQFTDSKLPSRDLQKALERYIRNDESDQRVRDNAQSLVDLIDHLIDERHDAWEAIHDRIWPAAVQRVEEAEIREQQEGVTE